MQRLYGLFTSIVGLGLAVLGVRVPGFFRRALAPALELQPELARRLVQWVMAYSK
jgi:hypothetical protein